MVFMPWTEELLTGIDAIDEQHRWLVETTNALHDEVTAAAPDGERIGEILYGLVDYTYNHFLVEEELFKRFDYPETEAHLKMHNTFTARASELLDQHEKGEVVTVAALEFLKEWLVQHIMKSDKEYVPFLRDKI